MVDGYGGQGGGKVQGCHTKANMEGEETRGEF